MAHGTLHVTPSSHQPYAGAGVSGRRDEEDAGREVPGRTLTLTLDNTPAALRRVTSVLGTIPVTRLSYASTTSPWATARITVPSADAARARNKLDRLVEVLSVEVLSVEVPSVEDTAPAHSSVEPCSAPMGCSVQIVLPDAS
ncbi:hypothetical protein AB0M64_10185 [Streptomyces sp. NPDC051771]|uniref:hypothetical protein n=1 Tax=Streptomyces sp. NPDC051771 TaxID=3154847 RepID=UPI003439C32F